jgi:DNA-binding transcriptional ArsR family regulator
MPDRERISSSDPEAILSEDVPVTMPELPLRLAISAPEQLKAVSDPTRSRILGIIQNHPATAKQIADRLSIPPSTIGHHLQVLEEAGLAKVAARRLVRGIVAKYYTRTARIFIFSQSPDVSGNRFTCVDIVTAARDELAETTAAGGAARVFGVAFPHARLSPKRAQEYWERLDSIIEDLLHEQPDPEGKVYGVCVAMFEAPPYMQAEDTPGTPEGVDEPNRGAATPPSATSEDSTTGQ